MMKKALAVLPFLIFSNYSFCQKDSSSTVLISLEVLPPQELVVIIGGYILPDTAISYPILDRYSSIIKRRKFYTRQAGYKKFKIMSRDGILFCTLIQGEKIELAGFRRLNNNR